MNYFEQELRRISNACGEIINPTFAGRACYGDLGGDNRVKLEFVTQGHAGHYSALKATVLNRAEGEVDTLMFRFEDVWGRKQVSNPNFKSGLFPHIWTSDHKTEWYVYKPTDADMKTLGTAVGAYLGVFLDCSLIPEKSQGKAGAKDSVINEIRGAKPKRTTRKASPARNNSEPDL